MTSSISFASSKRFITTGAILLIVSVPLSASAASARPSCSLFATTAEGVAKIREKGGVLVHEGSDITINWESRNAKTATDMEGDEIALSGSVTDSPDKTTTYSYRFASGSSKVICTATVYVVKASIDASSLATSSSKPTISGTASGTKSVIVTVRKDGSNAIAYKSRAITVKNGKWKAKVTKKLADGTYNVSVSSGVKNVVLTSLTDGVLTIGKNARNTSSSSKVATTLTVASVPLLFGGTAHAGASVPISYLQVTNVGIETATLKGFYVKQNGTAPVESIVGFTTVDDKGGSRGATPVTPGVALFKNGVAFAPTDATFAPGQMRLFTIRAILTPNIYAYLGKQLMIDVDSIDTNATPRGQFPIKGTTWTIAN